MPETSRYIESAGTTSTAGEYITLSNEAWQTLSAVTEVGADLTYAKTTNKPGKIEAGLYFRYIKSKLGFLEGRKFEKRMKSLEAGFLAAVENGQDALAEKIMKELTIDMRESLMFAKGITKFIDYDVLHKYKNKIKGGHISDTKFKEFTRVIPKDVLTKKKKIENLFDGFVIYHYWDEKAEDHRAKKQKVSETERSRMRDPILFGVIKETNKLYFIADWEDEFCDLTFDQIVKVVGEHGKIEAEI